MNTQIVVSRRYSESGSILSAQALRNNQDVLSLSGNLPTSLAF